MSRHNSSNTEWEKIFQYPKAITQKWYPLFEEEECYHPSHAVLSETKWIANEKIHQEKDPTVQAYHMLMWYEKYPEVSVYTQDIEKIFKPLKEKLAKGNVEHNTYFCIQTLTYCFGKLRRVDVLKAMLPTCIFHRPYIMSIALVHQPVLINGINVQVALKSFDIFYRKFHTAKKYDFLSNLIEYSKKPNKTLDFLKAIWGNDTFSLRYEKYAFDAVDKYYYQKHKHSRFQFREMGYHFSCEADKNYMFFILKCNMELVVNRFSKKQQIFGIPYERLSDMPAFYHFVLQQDVKYFPYLAEALDENLELQLELVECYDIKWSVLGKRYQHCTYAFQHPNVPRHVGMYNKCIGDNPFGVFLKACRAGQNVDKIMIERFKNDLEVFLLCNETFALLEKWKVPDDPKLKYYNRFIPEEKKRFIKIANTGRISRYSYAAIMDISKEEYVTLLQKEYFGIEEQYPDALQKRVDQFLIEDLLACYREAQISECIRRYHTNKWFMQRFITKHFQKLCQNISMVKWRYPKEYSLLCAYQKINDPMETFLQTYQITSEEWEKILQKFSGTEILQQLDKKLTIQREEKYQQQIKELQMILTSIEQGIKVDENTTREMTLLDYFRMTKMSFEECRGILNLVEVKGETYQKFRQFCEESKKKMEPARRKDIKIFSEINGIPLTSKQRCQVANEIALELQKEGIPFVKGVIAPKIQEYFTK